MILISGGVRVAAEGVVSYDYVMFEEGLRHGGLVTVDLLASLLGERLSSNVPPSLGGHSFGIGAPSFHVL